MKIKWIGHACFCITSETGEKIVTDPYKVGLADDFKYGPINESADIVTVSHDHGDHNEVSAISGNPTVIKGPGTVNVKGIEFKGIATFHDQVKGAKRGSNTIFTFQVDDIRLTHLGDLGHPLSPEQLGELEGTEVLFAPTGGGPTLELQEVIELWERLRPKIVIPMHFKTAKTTFPKYGADDIIHMRPGTKKVGTSDVFLSKSGLPTSIQILILEPSC